jgi:hypothetical protein
MNLNFLVMHFLELALERAWSHYPFDYQSDFLIVLRSEQMFLSLRN